MSSYAKVYHHFGKLYHSLYAFPLVVIVIFSLLTAFKVNGSSVGVYHATLYGSRTKDKPLVVNHPQPIRSDEWRASTVFTIMQSKSGYPTFNTLLGSGRDVSIMPDLPTKNWLTIFRPQNLLFFILPLENAFAFRWWFGIALLLIAAYFFVLRILNGNKKLAIILSLSFGLSPFLLWWYQSALLIPLAYSLLIMIVAIKLISRERIKPIKSQMACDAIYLLALTYMGASFAFFLYAPFLIPIAIVVIAFVIGYLMDRRLNENKLTNTQLFKVIGSLLVPMFVVLLLIVAFVVSHRDMISAISNSEYPGHRIVKSGELPFSPVFPILGSYLMPLIQSSIRGTHYYVNQSEASNFILFLPFLIIPGIVLQVKEFISFKRINYTFLAIQLVAVVFLLRITVHFGDKFYNLLLLQRVPNNRLMVGIGLVGFLQLVYFIQQILAVKVKGKRHIYLALLNSTLIFAILVVFGRYVAAHYPVFLNENYILISLALFFTSVIFLLLIRKVLLAAIVLLAFTIMSSFKVMPLYRGLGFLNNSQIINKIGAVSHPADTWVVLDNENYENLPLAAGRGDIGGAQIYSDLNFWRQIDKSGDSEYVYNRQAHALFLSNTLPPNPKQKFNVSTVADELEYVKQNLFKVRFECNDFTYRNIDYVLTVHELNKDCLSFVDKVKYPKRTFYIYKVRY
jgi:hypothetical protein